MRRRAQRAWRGKRQRRACVAPVNTDRAKRASSVEIFEKSATTFDQRPPWEKDACKGRCGSTLTRAAAGEQVG